MYSLPPARKIWRCGYVNNEPTSDGCEQWIYQSQSRKFASGKYMVLNFSDGVGGLANDVHVCPKRVGSKFHKIEPIDIGEYNYHQENFPCVSCGETFNKLMCPLCPTCFKMECRKCGDYHSWIVTQDSMYCPSCGNIGCDVRQVFTGYERLYGKFLL